MNNLKQKYNLPNSAAVSELAIKYVLDNDINSVGLSRINKINQFIKARTF